MIVLPQKAIDKREPLLATETIHLEPSVYQIQGPIGSLYRLGKLWSQFLIAVKNEIIAGVLKHIKTKSW